MRSGPIPAALFLEGHQDRLYLTIIPHHAHRTIHHSISLAGESATGTDSGGTRERSDADRRT